MGKEMFNTPVSSDRYNRLLFEEFGAVSGFDAAYLLEEDGSILEVIAEPAARTGLASSWDEAAFIEAIDQWVQDNFSGPKLDNLKIQIFTREATGKSSHTRTILH